MLLKRINYVLYIIAHVPIVIMHLLIAIIIVTIVRYFIFPSRLRRRIHAKIKCYVFHLGYCILEMFFPIPFTAVHKKISGTDEPSQSLIISNHVSDFDWMYIAYVAEKDGYFEDLRITMKEEVKRLPFIGYLLKCFGSVFLSRGHDIKTDQNRGDTEKMVKLCQTIVKNGENFNVLLFPEGTYACQDSLEKSVKYYSKLEESDADSLNVFQPKKVLLPHILGFQKILLSKPTDLKIIRNLTLFTTPYTPSVFDNYKYSELALGEKSFHVNVLTELVQIPNRIANIISKIREIDNNVENHGYKKLMKEFEESTTSFLNGLFARKQEMIEAYSGKTELSGDDFLMFCKNFSSSTDEFTVKTYKITSPLKFLYRGLPLLCFLLLAGFSIYYLIYHKTPLRLFTKLHESTNHVSHQQSTL